MLHYDDKSFEIPEWDGTRREVGELWRMQKDGHVAVCSVWTHPEGAELRLTVGGGVKQTDSTHHVFALSVVAHAWRERFHWLKGWNDCRAYRHRLTARGVSPRR
jgi:hypothetical protein